jgi:hypothetical protein
MAKWESTFFVTGILTLVKTTAPTTQPGPVRASDCQSCARPWRETQTDTAREPPTFGLPTDIRPVRTSHMVRVANFFPG